LMWRAEGRLYRKARSIADLHFTASEVVCAYQDWGPACLDDSIKHEFGVLRSVAGVKSQGVISRRPMLYPKGDRLLCWVKTHKNHKRV